jgi:hypothetical protein
MSSILEQYERAASDTWEPTKRPVPEVEKGHVYGTITCIPADEMPRMGPSTAKKLPWGFWEPFLDEIHKRLECTQRNEALQVPFASAELARRARYVLRESYGRKYGKRMVEVYQRDNRLFIRRGPNWGRYPEPELKAVPATKGEDRAEEAITVR